MRLKISLLFSVILLMSNIVEAQDEIIAVCNGDQLVCGKIENDSIEKGILPYALQNNGISNIKFIDFSEAFLTGNEFDIAILPSDQAEHWEADHTYFSYNLALKNELIKISPANTTPNIKYLTPASICHEQGYDFKVECAPLSKIFREFSKNNANVIAYESQIKFLFPFDADDYHQEVLKEINYVMLINKSSILASYNLRDDIINAKGMSPYQIALFILIIALLSGGYFIASTLVTNKLDQQSGCFAKKEFEKRLKKTVSNGRTVMLLDYNNFKKVNDQKGHQIGDHVIERVSAEIIKILRKGDKIYRIGGDEFFLEFNNQIPKERANQVFEQIHAIGDLVSKEIGLEDLRFGLSIGKLNIEKGDSFKSAYALVDHEMYKQKMALKEQEQEQKKDVEVLNATLM